MSGGVRVLTENGVAQIVIDRPERRNALTPAMIADLCQALERLAVDEATSVVVLCAVGQDFCLGMGLDDISAAMSPDPARRAESFEQGLPITVHPLLRALWDLPQPLVAAVRGHAIGLGLVLALAADVVLVSRTARCVLPQVRLGHTPDHGESWLLPRRVGPGRAAAMALLALPLSGEEAVRHGLAFEVTSDDQLEARTAEVAERLRSLPGPAVRATKQLLRSSAASSLEEQLDLEVRAAAGCAATDEFVEAVVRATSRGDR